MKSYKRSITSFMKSQPYYYFRALLILSLIFLLPSAVAAQSKTLNQLTEKVILLDPVLGNSAVTCLLQTQDRYIWIATEAGLARFDGVQFKVFNTLNTNLFSTDHISTLWEDRNGRLWIGTYGGGVLSYQNGQFTVAYSAKNGLLTDVVRAIYGDSTGTLWIATGNDGPKPGGLNRVQDGKISAFTVADKLPVADIWTLYEDREKQLWIGTYGGGVARYFNGSFTTFSTKDGLAGNDVRSICQDKDGAIWIGTHDGGLSRYHNNSFTNFTTADGLSSNLIIRILERNGELWIGTANSGLNRFHQGKFESLGLKDGLPSETVGALLFDREGNLWLGAPGALCALQNGPFTTYTSQEGLSFNIVCPVLESRQGDLWIGTFGGGLNRYRNGVFTHYRKKDGLPGDNINSLLEDRDGQLWIGTYGDGLSRFDGQHFTNYATKDGLLSSTIKALCQDREGTIWIGTDGGGLYQFRNGTFKSYTTKDGLVNDIIIVIVEDGGGGLWIGTDGGGLSHFDSKGFTNYTTKDGLANNRVWSLYRESDGALWIGTDFGLTLLKDGRFTVFTRRQGLVAESVNQILDDQLGNLWISCPRGVYRVTKRELMECVAGSRKAVTPVVYGISDGLKSEQCTRWFQPAGCRARDGRLWFPTVKGVATVNPASVMDAPLPPKSFVEAVLVDGRDLDLNLTPEMQMSRDRFEFRYTCLSFTAPEKMNFRYKLDGFDADWQEAGTKRSAFYTNIPPGEYLFKVIVRSGDGVWSEVGTSPRFRILIPWWKSWPAYLVYIFTIALIAGAVFLLRLRALQQWNTRLQTTVADRTAELAEKVAQVQRSEQLFHAFMDNSPVVAYIKDRNGRFLYLNKTLGQLWSNGNTSSLLSKTDFDLIPSAMAEQIRTNDLQVMESGKITEFIEETPGLDGKLRSWLSLKFPITKDDGQVNLCGISIDITERLKLEQDLRAANETLSRLIEASPLGIIAFQIDGGVTQWNEAAEKIYGWTKAEAMAGGAAQVVPEDKQAEFQGLIKQLLLGEPFVEFETERVRKDGTRIPVTISATSIKDVTGKINVIVGMHTDITERKRASEAILEAKEAAEAATLAKSEFLANMSHEIRTPMNAIIGMTGLLLDTNLDNDQMEFATTIRASGDTLLSLINDILDFSKIEAGQLDLEEVPFDVQDCIEETLDVMSAKAAEKHLDLAYLVENDVPRLLAGDIGRLRQILVNLVGNAVKFTATGDILITLCASHLRGDQYELKFAIRDTGIGIPTDRMDRLFRSFSQVDASTTRHYGGTGLGLAISRRLAELMGGRMWVESELGKGSTFYFTITARSMPNQPRVYQSGMESSLNGKRILIVDDNSTNRRVLALQTQGWGMLPSLAESGQAALELLRTNQPFQLAILDMNMPIMNGLELASAIRALSGREELRLILLSSMGQTKGLNFSEAGFSQVLTKPVKAAQLYNILLQALGAQPTAPAKLEAKPLLDRSLGERHPLRILLAEDNVVNQKVALRILERMGYRADVAANGLEAIEALRRQPYDLILMDVQMPVMDGYEAARRITAEWPDNKRPRIIALTANTMRGDQEKCFAAGMDEFISKPVKIEELQSVLARSSRLMQVETTPERTGPVTLDTKAIEQLRMLQDDDDPHLVKELIEMFLNNAPTALTAMQIAIVSADAPTLERIAHSLKGSSGNLGANKMVKFCAELEHIGNSGILTASDTILTALKEEFERVTQALLLEIREKKSPEEHEV